MSKRAVHVWRELRSGKALAECRRTIAASDAWATRCSLSKATCLDCLRTLNRWNTYRGREALRIVDETYVLIRRLERQRRSKR